jgi:threonine synthase
LITLAQEKLKALQCTNCASTYAVDSRIYSCSKCGGILEVLYDYDVLAECVSRSVFESERDGVWKYFHLLPLRTKQAIISLSEGGTNLIKSKRLAEDYGLKNLHIKDETRNPTGSFKDRPNTVSISKACEFGAHTIAVASSGNAAGSLSAYAAKAGLRCIVAVPADVPLGKLTQIMICGPKIVKVRGTYSSAFNLIREACLKYSWHNLTSVCSANPYQVEGDKTVAYELSEQLDWNPPDWVTVPLGAGPLLVGTWKGFKELYRLDLIRELPKMVGVQAEGCSPIVRAFKEGKMEVTSWTEPKTIAHSIADPLVGYAQDGTLALNRIRESHGVAESVTDDEMVEAISILARREGIFAEPAASASLAVVKKLKDAGVIAKDDCVVSLVTGTGLKSPEPILKTLIEPRVIEADLAELEKVV